MPNNFFDPSVDVSSELWWDFKQSFMAQIRKEQDAIGSISPEQVEVIWDICWRAIHIKEENDHFSEEEADWAEPAAPPK